MRAMRRNLWWLPMVLTMLNVSLCLECRCYGFVLTGQRYPAVRRHPQQQRLPSSNNDNNNNNPQNMVKDKEEPLSLMFQRAVALQRAGEYQQSLKEYETFVKAAKQCEVDSSMYAEVLCNIGSIYVKLGTLESSKGRSDHYYDIKAQEYYEQALESRRKDAQPLGTAHVNLALLSLKQGSQTMDPQKGYESLQKAQYHCQKVIMELPITENENVQPLQMAKKLLVDIDRMIQQMNQQSSK